MKNAATDPPATHSVVRKDTAKVIELLQTNRKNLLELWVDVVREEFNEPESTSDHQIANHMLYIIDALIVEFKNFASNPVRSKSTKQGDMQYDDGIIEDDKDAGEDHGRQRAGINAYNADKVFWEYVLLRKIIVNFLQEHRQLDIDHMEIITCVIENCSRDSLITFSNTLQTVQSKLLSTIVHDIRNPLNTISMMGEYLSTAEDSEKSALFASKIVSISERISVMLEDMLSTLSAEAGQGLDLNFSEQNMHSLTAESVVESLAVYGPRLKFDARAKRYLAVFDEIMVKRVLENIISNAFRYGDKTSDVTLTIYESESSVFLDIHNFGDPIEENRQLEIFKFLKRFEGKEAGSQRSWGIGLAFVKAVVDGHQGKVSVTSDAIEGTRFIVEFPKRVFKEGDSITVSI